MNIERNNAKIGGMQRKKWRHSVFAVFWVSEVNSKEIAQRAALIRSELNLSQKAIAERMGVSLRSWQGIEAGRNIPSGETLVSFEKLGVNPGWILSGLGPIRMRDWNGSDADAELFVRIARFVQRVHEELNVSIPDRGSAKIAKSVFDNIARILPRDAGPEETDAALLMQEAKLRRELLAAKDAPGTGKRSA